MPAAQPPPHAPGSLGKDPMTAALLDSVAGPIPAVPLEPRIELHVHLEGAIRAHTLLALAERNGITLPVSGPAELDAFYTFTDFNHFIDVWNVTTNVLVGAPDFRRVVVDYAREAASHGAVYVEGIFSPGQYYTRGIEPRELFEGFAEGAAEAAELTGVEVRLTPDIDRNRPLDLSERIIRDAAAFGGPALVGIGLGGREDAAPAAHFRDLFALAADLGLAAVPHAGEVLGADSVRDCVELLGARRIRHGFRALEDPSLVTELAERGIVLDICPTSNLRTRVVPTWDAHPLPALVASPLAITINTDDPAMFDTDLSTEHALAHTAGASPERLFRAGITGQLGGDATAQRLTALADAHWGTSPLVPA